MPRASELATDHWDGVAADAQAWRLPLWRAQSDAVNAYWLERWLPPALAERVLKTDLFDELAGSGLLQLLGARARSVVAIDISELAVATVAQRHPAVETLVADVRRLPFPDRSFDVVVSNSTLDHLVDRSEAAEALGELARVLTPGGRLLLTLDNPLNPLIAARNALPTGAARRLRRVPYDAGWTCGPRALRSLLADTGLDVRDQTAIMHVPRAAVALVGSRGELAATRWATVFRAGERLERLPTRYVTGHFVAALAFRAGS
jgi:SAM-dependent methyltransferase